MVGCSGSEATPLERISYVGERVLLLTENGERDFVVGVNLGATIPGHGAGELAIRVISGSK